MAFFYVVEFVIKKGDDFCGVPFSILENGRERWEGGKDRAHYETEEYIILSHAEYEKKVAEFCAAFCGNWKEITEGRYIEMLEILPPEKWEGGGFFIMEAHTLDIHSFYQEHSGKYYEAFFRINTPRNKIINSLYEFINKKAALA